MKIVLEQEGVKRELDGSFNICLSRQDLWSLVQVLQSKLAEAQFQGGWFTVYDVPTSAISGTMSKKWSE